MYRQNQALKQAWEEAVRVTAASAAWRRAGGAPRLRAAAAAFLALLATAFAQQPEPAPGPQAEGESETAVFLPEAPDALFRLGQRMENEGKIAVALDIYTRFSARFPSHALAQEAGYRLGKCLDSVGRVDDAIKHLEAVTRVKSARFRNRPDALFLLGKLHGDLTEYEKACAVLESLLEEGAGAYEEEALNLCGGYYAAQKKYSEAAGKMNVLRQRSDSRYAESAAFKLAQLWFEAGNLDLAAEAVSDLAQQYPGNSNARGLMLRLAEVLRQQRRFAQALTVCDQLKAAFPASREARAAGYLAGLCYRDQKMADQAVETLIATSRIPENQKNAIGVEALIQAADILFTDKADIEKAKALYAEASTRAQDYADLDRRQQVLELCYFRLAEYHFQKKQWSEALEFYKRLRKVGTRLNVTSRIMKCQVELGAAPESLVQGAQEIAFLRKKIAESPGTFAAAEGETFIADQLLQSSLEPWPSLSGLVGCVGLYEAILNQYKPVILAETHLHSYVYVQLGRCHAALADLERLNAPAGKASGKILESAIQAFEKALSVDPQTPYVREALEGIARAADLAGLPDKAYESYKKLHEWTGEKLKAAPEDKALREDRTGYLRGMLSRAGRALPVEKAVALSRGIIEKEGAGSTAARHALFYLGETYYLQKDYPAAIRQFDEYISAFGPKRNAAGDFADGPWQAQTSDDDTDPLCLAALRIAHAWFQQNNQENMIKAYAWMVRNLPAGNRYAAEANYWLALDPGKGQAGESREARRALADRLWTSVVSTVAIKEFPVLKGAAAQTNLFRSWVTDAAMLKYSKLAILKTGEILSELGEHAAAAKAFNTYLALYPLPPTLKDVPPPVPDDLTCIAHYALGQEYLALRDIPGMVALYRTYLDGMRGDRFRISALRFLGFHASAGDLKPYGIAAYATILDEYGVNPKDEWGKTVAVPKAQWIRQTNPDWTGLRLPYPQNFDFGQVRYALGFLYWKNREWDNCTRALEPFVNDPELAQNASRARALYLLGKCHFKRQDFAKGVRALNALIAAHPEFEAIEEVCMQAAEGCMKTKDWPRIVELHALFSSRFPSSSYRPYLDLYHAKASMEIPARFNTGFSQMNALARSDTYRDVKADALYYKGQFLLATASRDEQGAIDPSDYKKAADLFSASVDLFPRPASCFEAAKCKAALRNWSGAKPYLDRLLRDFPDTEPETLRAAKALLLQVQKEMAQTPPTDKG